MPRFLSILISIALIIALVAGVQAAAYGVGALAEAYLFQGAARLTNILFLMLVFVMILSTLLTLAERKWSAMMQDRVGPNRARIGLPGLKNRPLAGLPHVAADSLKMLFKEDFIPKTANKFLFTLGPILAFAPAFALFAVIPVGPTVAIGGRPVDMVVATPEFGILYVFAIASLAVYGTAIAGWASNNKFALLGGVRASSQMISYEVALGMSLVGLMMAFSSVQLPAFVDGQTTYLWQTDTAFDFGIPAWGLLLQPLGFLLFFAAAFAETKRAPFDAPEGESEIIGYYVEYSGMKFGMFMISEFVEIVALSGVIVALFLGGYHLPFGGQWLSSLPVFQDHGWLWGTLLGTVFWVKVLFMCWLQLTIRWTFPRFRYDQIQALGWKVLLELAIVNVFISGALILWDPSLRALAWFGAIVLAIIVAMTLSRPARPEGHEGEHGHGGGHGAQSPAEAAHGSVAAAASHPH